MQGRESCFQTTICKDARRRGSRTKEGEREEKIFEGYVVFCSDLFDGVAPKSDLNGLR